MDVCSAYLPPTFFLLLSPPSCIQFQPPPHLCISAHTVVLCGLDWSLCLCGHNAYFMAFLSGLAGWITMHPQWVLCTIRPGFNWLEKQHLNIICKGGWHTRLYTDRQGNLVFFLLHISTVFISTYVHCICKTFAKPFFSSLICSPTVWESPTSLKVVDRDASYLWKEHITPTQPLHSHH